jgi:hypothetical protein
MDHERPCPRCGCICGEDKVDEVFGYRTLDEGYVVRQSYCRTCRNEHKKEMAER